MLSTQGNRCGAKSVASKNTGHSAALGQLHQHQIFAPRTLYTGARGGQSYARQRRHSGKGKLTYSHYRKFLLLLGSTQAPLRSTCHDIVCIFCPNHMGTDHCGQPCGLRARMASKVARFRARLPLVHPGSAARILDHAWAAFFDAHARALRGDAAPWLPFVPELLAPPALGVEALRALLVPTYPGTSS